MTKQDASTPAFPESYTTFWTTSPTALTSEPPPATSDRNHQRAGFDACSEFVDVTEDVLLIPPVLRK